MNPFIRALTTNGSPKRATAFLQQLRVAQATIQSVDPWVETLRKLKGQRGTDGVERVATDHVFETLKLEPFKRTPEAAKRVKTVMLELGWTPVRGRHLTSKGYATRVRGYARSAAV